MRLLLPHPNPPPPPQPPDPRVQAVNQPRRIGVLDLHFQSTKTAIAVLDALLEPELEAVSQLAERTRHRPTSGDRRTLEGLGGLEAGPMVWIVTGTGHHTGRTHVKAGALFDCVNSYLSDLGFNFVHGKDGSGKRGAFGVAPFL